MMNYDENHIRELICEIGKRMYAKEFVVANDGNISVKISDTEVLCTPASVSKGFMTPDMICKVDIHGNTLWTNGENRPSSEVKMHLRVYRERPDIGAVVHAHPPYATAYAVMNKPLDRPIIPESVIYLGAVPVAKYGTPSTDEIPDAVSEYIQDTDALLLQNHGALVYGQELETVYYRMESLEFYARITFLCDMLGLDEENILDSGQVQDLYKVRENMKVLGRHINI